MQADASSLESWPSTERHTRENLLFVPSDDSAKSGKEASRIIWMNTNVTLCWWQRLKISQRIQCLCCTVKKGWGGGEEKTEGHKTCGSLSLLVSDICRSHGSSAAKWRYLATLCIAASFILYYIFHFWNTFFKPYILLDSLLRFSVQQWVTPSWSRCKESFWKAAAVCKPLSHRCPGWSVWGGRRSGSSRHVCRANRVGEGTRWPCPRLCCGWAAATEKTLHHAFVFSLKQ